MAKDWAKFIGTGMGILAGAAFLGFKVNFDDPDDSDWLKIVIEHTRINVFGATLPLARIMARTGLLITDRMGLKTKGRKYKPKGNFFSSSSPIDMMFDFGKYRISPWLSFANTAITGKNIVGQEKTVPEALYESSMMLYVQDFQEAYEIYGTVGSGLATAGFGFIGSRINTYEKSTKAKRSLTIQEYKLMLKGGAYVRANRLLNDFNTENPDNIIDPSKLQYK